MPAELRDLVFLSYSHRDKRWLDELLTHLKPYVRDGSITAWSDRQIQAGSKWMTEIQSALERTKVAVLLVTPHFLASDFIHDHELAPLLVDAEVAGVSILWIHVRASSFEKSPIKQHQAVIDPTKPIAQMRSERDAAWVQICKTIEAELKSTHDATQKRATEQIAGTITPPLHVLHPEIEVISHRPLLRDLERSMAGGMLQDSSLAPVVHAALSREASLKLSTPFDSMSIVNGIRLSDEYFGPINASAGERDWQRDFVAVATPTLVGLARSLQRSAAAQALVIRLCNLLADQLHLRLKWPDDDDQSNELKNEIYYACLKAGDLENDDVYISLKRLSVIGPAE